MMLAGSITFLPKIHCPVSTTTKLAPTSSVASSILPTEPPLASTLNPSSWHRLDSHVCSRHCPSVLLSTLLMRTSCFGSPHPYPVHRHQNTRRGLHFRCQANKVDRP